jgi:hypothetical protein
MKTRLFFSAITFMALAVIASAQTAGQSGSPAGKARAQGSAWVDANNDGICDNYQSGVRHGRGPGNGQGQAAAAGRGSGPGKGQGLHNGQGRRQSTAAGTGQGRGSGQGRFNGRGPAFIDADNDGICDNLAAGKKG